MTLKKKRRLYILLGAMLGLGAATALMLTAFQDNLVFFYSPSDLKERPVGTRAFRLGGMVEKGSVQRTPAALSARRPRVAPTAPSR